LKVISKVRLALLDDIDDEQLEWLAPDVGARVPLPYRFEDEISWFVGIASAMAAPTWFGRAPLHAAAISCCVLPFAKAST
jgi:hypothetical protein